MVIHQKYHFNAVEGYITTLDVDSLSELFTWLIHARIRVDYKPEKQSSDSMSLPSKPLQWNLEGESLVCFACSPAPHCGVFWATLLWLRAGVSFVGGGWSNWKHEVRSVVCLIWRVFPPCESPGLSVVAVLAEACKRQQWCTSPPEMFMLSVFPPVKTWSCLCYSVSVSGMTLEMEIRVQFSLFFWILHQVWFTWAIGMNDYFLPPK